MTSEEFKAILKDRGIKQKHLAAELGVSETSMVNYLSGKAAVPRLVAYYVRTTICNTPPDEARKMDV